MAIVTQPVGGANTDIYAAYGRELYYQFTESVDLTLGGPIKNAVITFKNSLGATIITPDIVVRIAPTSTNTIGNIQTGTFDFDSSAIMQTLFCTREKPEIFPIQFGRDTAINTPNVKGGGNLEVTYEREDNAGLLVSTGTLDTTDSIQVINGTVQQREAAVKGPYIIANPDRRFLTKRPLCTQVCLTESDYLYFYKDDGINAIEVSAIKPSSQEIGIIDISAVGNNELAMIGSGPENIDSFSFIFGGVTMDTTVISYEVTVGFWDGFAFTAVSETIKYVMTPCCPEKDCRLFWLNRLGGVDAYTFRGNNQTQNNPKSRQYEKPLSIPRMVPDYGIGKYDSRDNSIGTFRTWNLSLQDSIWLQELYTSPQVCKALQDSDGILRPFPVVVEDSQNIIIDTETGIYQHEIQIIEAVPRIIQQYY